MFSVSAVRVKRIADVPLCRLVYGTALGSPAAGIVVENPFNPEQRGVLYLPPLPEKPEIAFPAFSPGDMTVMDLGQNAEFVWSGAAEAVSERGPGGSDLGVLGISTEDVALMGKAFGGGYRPDQHCYWNIATGKVASNGDFHKGACITQWQVGWRDVEGEFHTLAKFPLPSR